MLSSTALGVPRFSMTSERCSSSTLRRSLPNPVRARSADTTIVSLPLPGCIATLQFNYLNCTVDPQPASSQRSPLVFFGVDAQLAHLGLQRRPLHAQARRGPLLAAHPSMGLAQGAQY